MAFAERQTNKPLKKAAAKGGMDTLMADSDDFFGDKENSMPGMDAPKASKKKTVEETYQKLTQLEHVLLRPDTYIGSTEMNRTKLWVHDMEIGLNQREVTYVPGLYKIFDEILVNAADNKQRDKNMDTLKVMIDPENNSISVWNNGQGIPVEVHKEEKCWVPELIFGHLLTSSNYNDNEKKTTGGRNGYGAKLANIFSTEFTVETADGSRSGKKFKQTFTNNMQSKGDAKVKDCKASDNWTCITFKPDLAKFGMQCLDADIVALMMKRVYDMAGTTPGVKVYLQDERLKIKTFEDYCALYLKAAGRDSESGEAPKHVHIKANDRWELVVAVSEGQFQQVSFVNSIATTRGGSHVNHCSDQVATLFLEHLAKKHKGLKLKPFQVKNHLWLFVNSLIENPAFDSQTKETLTLKPSAFGSKVELDDKFFKKMLNGTGILDSILSFGQEKQERDMKKTDGKKTGRITGIPKLEDANDAGTKHGLDCTLILTEGDSAKALAVSGLAVVGRNRYGVFPLRGKVANPRDANHEQIMKNEEIKNLKTILGLQQTNKYPDGPQGLRYGHVMIMADQDPDGSHIKGLLINLFHYYWPNLLKYPGFLKEFATPIVKAKKRAGKQEIAFFTLQEYEEWRESVGDGLHLWTIKYYKGLGTSSSQEAKEYFSNLPLHQMDFAWEGAEDGEIIDMVFSKKRADDRKQWLLRYEDDLYVDHNASEVTYSDFVNKELIHFSMMDNMRSIPSLVDGLKPGQRKILYACFKRKLKAEIKVAQLAGYVAEHSAYHHGEQSLAMTIVNMAQSFVGSNNINLLSGEGQFGTRLQGGADAASPRYIFTLLNQLTRSLFHESDDAVLKYLDDDGQSIEPQWYVPVLPMILVNGGHGIGTGWSTDVPTYNPRDIVENIRRLLRHEPMEPMHPWFKGFNGQVELNVGKKGDISYAISGKYHKTSETTIEITELPVNKWTQQYKEFLETLLDTDGGKKEPFIKGYKEWHTDTTVHFEVTMSEKSMRDAEEVGIMKKFQLTRNLSTSNMHLFNQHGQIQKYASPEDILREFFGLRLQFYDTRKAHMIGELEKQLSVLDNKCRFIREVVAGSLKVSNRKKAAVVEDLAQRGYTQQLREPKKKGQQDEPAEDAEPEPEPEAAEGAPRRMGGYDYLLNMPIMSLTLERVEQLQSERDGKEAELTELQALSSADLWDRDLEAFMERYEQYEADEHAKATQAPPKKKGAKGKPLSKAKAAKKRRKSWGGSDASDSDDDAFDDDGDSDDDFQVAKKKAPAKRPAPAPPKPAPSSKPAQPAKKVDTKDTPDKSVMRPSAPAPKPPKPTDDDDEDDLPSLSLFDRLNAKVAAPAAAKPPSAFAAKEAPKPKKAAASKPAAKPKAAPKKAKDESDDDEFMEDALSALGEVAPAPSDKPRRAAAKKPIVVESDEDEEVGSGADSEDDFAPEEEEEKPKPKRKPAAAKPKKAAALESDDDEGGGGGGSDDDFDPVKEKKAKAKAAPPAKKPAPKKKVVLSESEEEEEEEAMSEDDFAATKKTARRPGYGNKGTKTVSSKPTATTKTFDVEAAAKAKAKPAAKAAAKKAAPKKKAESDSDDFMGDALGRPHSDSEDEDVAPARPAAARPGRRAAAQKKTYKLDDDSGGDDSEVELLDEDSGSDFEG